MKTIDEAAKECCEYMPDWLREHDEKFKNLFCEGVEFAQKWIPVEKALPPKASDSENRWNHTHGFSLPVITKNDEFMPTYYKIQSYNVELKAWQTSEKVTHWRPIELK